MELFKNVLRSSSIEFGRNAGFYRAEIGCVKKKDDNNNIAFVPVEKVTSVKVKAHRYTSCKELIRGLCLLGSLTYG